MLQQTAQQTVPQTQWRLMWRQFRRHKLALIGLIVLVPIYFVALFAGFFAPSGSDTAHTSLPYAPPQTIQLSTEHGLFVYGFSSTRNNETFEQTFTVDKSKIVDIGSVSYTHLTLPTN